jgi:hypothetical protein
MCRRRYGRALNGGAWVGVAIRGKSVASQLAVTVSGSRRAQDAKMRAAASAQ